ncbi:MarR family winged helix-turn-helix transcriptional regulator [Nocardia wallacei]|uniref:MarR family winged helix-turn-helix transcriptional regulator n=1 Tax=Nocardia wallacei TaxID=480035 RepID=UPI002458AD37|nr:MarR family transcriptional regulator [Nocardia wallacei]
MKSLHDIPGEADPASTAADRLFQLTELLGAMMERGMADRGLTQARARLLWALHHHGPMTQRTLADLLAVTPRNITGLVDGLTDDGYVTRRPHPTDRRALLVSLTGHGHTFTTTLRDERDTMAAALFGDTPPADLRTFLTVIDTAITRLRSTPPDDCPTPDTHPNSHTGQPG